MEEPESSTARAKQHNDYTVGIICAIQYEMSAVRYMLDREPPRLPSVPGSQFRYTLGEMSGHNVVIGCLAGNQGNSASAVLAKDMDACFPLIQWRFMSGIGGGIPTRHDIRLGDVMVGMPEGEYGGVVQYDLDKAMEDRFQRKGFLAVPPTTVRSAVGEVQSQHDVADHKIGEFVADMVGKYPKPDKYSRPPAEKDVLFKPDTMHQDGQPNCEQYDKGGIVERESRPSDLSVIHYGLIA